MPERKIDVAKEYLLKEKSPFTPERLAELADVGIRTVKSAIKQLQAEGYVFRQVEDLYVRSKDKVGHGEINLSKRFDSRDLHFGIISDTHLGSKQERVEELNAMYEIFEREGVTTVLHAGDITEGHGVYRGQEFEVHKLGQQDQIDYAIETYPKTNIQTYFITGNHDLRQTERGGVDPGVRIGNERPDLNYLGQMTANVTIKGGVRAELLHPAGGIAYALSYKAQRDINNRAPDDLPDILVYGHYHTSFSMHYRGIDFLQAPCFKDQGLFEKRLGLNPTIGGWVVDAKISDDQQKIVAFKPHLFHFDKKV